MSSSRRAVKRRGGEMAGGDTKVTKNDLQILITTGNIWETGEDIGLLVATVDQHLKGPIVDELRKRIGDKFYEAAFNNALSLRAHRKVMQGELLPVKVSGSSLKHQIHYVGLVVAPSLCHLKMAYKSVLKFAGDNGCCSLVMSGLGCGRLGVEPKKSAMKLKEVVEEWSGGWGSLKTLKIIEKKATVVKSFAAVFRGKDEPMEAFVEEGMEDARKFSRIPDEISTEACPVCLDGLSNGEEVVALIKCSHQIHLNCFVNFLKSMNRKNCWVCSQFFAVPEGNMPQGTMNHHVSRNQKVPGFDDAEGAIVIEYNISGGVQGPTHLRPGIPFHGTHRVAYLPNNDKGRKVLRLLEKAFECKLTFTVGDSVTSGAQNVVVWNNVHHKTNLHGGAQGYGYPDAEYLDRVTEELAAQGIVEEDE